MSLKPLSCWLLLLSITLCHQDRPSSALTSGAVSWAW